MPPIVSRCRTVALLAALAAGCGPQHAPPQADLAALDQLLGLMHSRLALMHDVARAKWNAKRPITDPDRERELLSATVERARAQGVDPDLVRDFFTAQIEAARLVQQADFDRWQEARQGPFPDPPDLAGLRGRIDQLNRELLDTLGKLGPSLRLPQLQQALSARAREVLTGQGVPPAVREAAIAPLRRAGGRDQ